MTKTHEVSRNWPERKCSMLISFFKPPYLRPAGKHARKGRRSRQTIEVGNICLFRRCCLHKVFDVERKAFWIYAWWQKSVIFRRPPRRLADTSHCIRRWQARQSERAVTWGESEPDFKADKPISLIWSTFDCKSSPRYCNLFEDICYVSQKYVFLQRPRSTQVRLRRYGVKESNHSIDLNVMWHILIHDVGNSQQEQDAYTQLRLASATGYPPDSVVACDWVTEWTFDVAAASQSMRLLSMGWFSHFGHIPVKSHYLWGSLGARSGGA